VVVWKVIDSAEATFEVDNYETFVKLQSEAAMLQRQQAGAIIAARQRIVEGAVGMVEMALDSLSKRGVVQLDEERKAAMVSNLLDLRSLNAQVEFVLREALRKAGRLAAPDRSGGSGGESGP
jgi:hypothetical protein